MATCDVSLLTFIASAILSLPRPWIGVFIGYNLQLVADGRTSSASSCSVPHADVLADAKPVVSAAVSNISLALTIVTTLASGWYMRKKQRSLRVEVVRERCERRGAANPVSLAGGVYSTSTLEDGVPLLYPPRPSHAHTPSSESLSLKEVPSITERYEHV
jgi:hypothetical protein